MYDFLRGPEHQALGVFRGKRWKVRKTFLEATVVGLEGLLTATQWLRESVRTMVCGANLASHVHALGPFLLLLSRWCSAPCPNRASEFLVEASKAFLSSRFGPVHGVLRVAGNGPIETTHSAVIGERMVSLQCQAGHGRPHSGSWRSV